jgi:hypothetical protein
MVPRSFDIVLSNGRTYNARTVAKILKPLSDERERNLAQVTQKRKFYLPKTKHTLTRNDVDRVMRMTSRVSDGYGDFHSRRKARRKALHLAVTEKYLNELRAARELATRNSNGRRGAALWNVASYPIEPRARAAKIAQRQRAAHVLGLRSGGEYRAPRGWKPKIGGA